MNFHAHILILAIVLPVSGASAMDRWEALSMLESGNNDSAVGQRGEISRYQIKHQIWPGGDPHDSQRALAAAKDIMRQRMDRFQQSHGRAPTDFEFYVLWNAPVQVDHPSRLVAERAGRFENLVRRESSDMAARQ